MNPFADDLPADDRLRLMLAARINCHVDTWRLALFIAGAIVADPAIRAEIDRIGAAHAAGQPRANRATRRAAARRNSPRRNR